MKEIRYRGWTIWYDPPPIPTDAFNWHYEASDHESDDNACNGRCGTAATLDEAKDYIDDLIQEDPRYGPADQETPV